jgi:hypothetical protein
MVVKPRLLVLSSLLTYSVALALPALEFQRSGGDPAVSIGLMAALGGWAAVMVFNFAWFANPLYLYSLRLVLGRHWRSAAALGSLALLVALHATSLIGRQMPDGTFMIRLHAGFYVWLASMIVVILGSHAFRRGSLQ